MLQFVGLTLLAVLCVVQADDDKLAKEFSNCWKKDLMKEIADCATEAKNEKDDGVCMHKAMACILKKHGALAEGDNLITEKHQEFLQGMAANPAVAVKLCEEANKCYKAPEGGLELEAFFVCYIKKLGQICSEPSQ